MCGRATLTIPTLGNLAELVAAEIDPAEAADYRPRFNLAPTDPHWIVTKTAAHRRLGKASWGVGGKGTPFTINTRAETAAQRMRSAFAERRCLIPVDGFYEWIGDKTSRHPVWFHPTAGGVLLLAGLYDRREGLPPTFTILTTSANRLLAPVHDRMPVIVPAPRADEWLESPASGLLVPAEEGVLVGKEVAARANSVANDDAACLEAWVDRGQMRLL
jgi:putative SOS response-associated peptidase YedK